MEIGKRDLKGKKIMPNKELKVIDYKRVAQEMKNRGVTSTEDNWTNTLTEILEEFYEIETKVRRVFETLP